MESRGMRPEQSANVRQSYNNYWNAWRRFVLVKLLSMRGAWWVFLLSIERQISHCMAFPPVGKINLILDDWIHSWLCSKSYRPAQIESTLVPMLRVFGIVFYYKILGSLTAFLSKLMYTRNGPATLMLMQTSNNIFGRLYLSRVEEPWNNVGTQANYQFFE